MMSEEEVQKRIHRTVRDVERIKRKIQVGDWLRQEREVRCLDDNRLLAPAMEDVVVVAKYKFLVEVAGPGPELPKRTMTYVEILEGGQKIKKKKRKQYKKNTKK